jgi:hypothetical protein
MDRNHITRMISPSAAPAVRAFYMIGQSVISAPLTAPSTPSFAGFSSVLKMKDRIGSGFRMQRLLERS